MEITAYSVYWLVKCDAIVTLFVIMAVIFASITPFLVMAILEFDIGLRWCVLSFVFAILFAVSATLTPTTKQAAMICIAPKVLNSDVLRKDIPAEAKELYGLAKTWLQDKAKKEGSEE